MNDHATAATHPESAQTPVPRGDQSWSDAIRSTTTSPRIGFRDLLMPGALPNEPPVVLLHGVGSSSESWRELVPHLPPRWLLLPDYRGHGLSDTPSPPYTLGDFVDDLRRVLDDSGAERCDIVGFSLGALVGQRAALDIPDRIRSLALLSAIGGRTAAEHERAQARLGTIRETPPSENARLSVGRWFTPEFAAAHPELVEAEVAIISASDPIGYGASYEVLASNDLIDAVEGITCPVLITTGELDVGSTPRMSQLLHERIAGSSLYIVPGKKHYIHVECPEEVADRIALFWAGLG